MACPCKCPDCGLDIRRYGTVEGRAKHTRVIVKRCPCGRVRAGMRWLQAGEAVQIERIRDHPPRPQ